MGLLGHVGFQPDGHYCSSPDCMDSNPISAAATIVSSASHERGGQDELTVPGVIGVGFFRHLSKWHPAVTHGLAG